MTESTTDLKRGLTYIGSRQALIALILGILLTLLAFGELVYNENEERLRNFRQTARQHQDILNGRISSALEAVKSLKGLFIASDFVDRSEFRRFARLELEDQADIQALEWIPRVPHSEREAYENQARDSLGSNFSFTERKAQGKMVPAGRRNEYFPVYFMEPMKGNETAVGFDLASDARRLEALEQARDTGKAVASARITLVQETGMQFGFLLFEPVYEGEGTPKTIEKRRAKLRGFSLGVLKMGNFIEALSEDNGASAWEMKTFVFDLSAPAGEQLLFPAGSAVQSPAEFSQERCARMPMEVGGRDWLALHCRAGATSIFQTGALSWIVLLAGLLASLAFAAYLRALSVARSKSEAMMETLRKSEARYSDIVENTKILIQSVDARDGSYLFTNQGWRGALGYSREEALLLKFPDVIHPDQLDHCQNILRRVVSGQSVANMESTFVHKNGSLVHVEGHVVCRPDDDGTLITHGVFTDITERKKAEAKTEEIAHDLALLIDTANAPIFGIDRRGMINEWNQAAARMTGYAKDEVLNCNLVDEFVAEDFKESVKQVLDRALGGEETANYEFRLDIKSGERVDVLLNSTTRRDAAGNIVGVIGIGQDITQRKLAEAQVIQAAKLATLGEMATSVAHELNQPLNVIRMAAGNVLRKLEKGNADPTYLNDKLERIASQTERAAAIIDHMRMFGRKAGEKPTELDPREAVRGALGLMGEQLRLAEIEVVTDLSGTCRPVLGHQLQMEQVVLNLLTNARDAIQAKARDGEKKIDIAVDGADDGAVKIIVQDTGGGISKKIIGRIFEPFYTTKEMGKGTGLGLSVSYGIIRDMGGTIEAENADGGARFTITLPVAKTDGVP